MTARPIVHESRRRPVRIAVALVLLLAMVMAAGCIDEDYITATPPSTSTAVTFTGNPTGGNAPPGWDSYRNIVITNPSPVSGYEAFMNLTWLPGMKSNFNDIRFTALDSTTLLPYYIESKSDGKFAHVWIALPANANTIRVFYNNSAATSASDANQVFMVYDTFDGTSLDTTKWTTDGTPALSVSGSVLTMTGKQYAVSGIRTIQSFSFPLVIETREASYWGGGFNSGYFKYGWMNNPGSTTVTGYYNGVTSSNQAYNEFGITNGASAQSALTALQKPGNIVVNAGSPIVTSAITYKKLALIYASGNIRAMLDGVQLGSTSTSAIPAGSAPIGFACAKTEFAPSNLHLDWVRVRHYAATEPTLLLS